MKPTKEQLRLWRKWVAARPPQVRVIAEKFDPWTLYWLADPGQRVTVVGFDEGEPGVTLRVNVLGEFNLVTHERCVFGIRPELLTECDLPSPDEPVGALLTEAEVEENLDAMRLLVRPDLWVMGADGKARRKQ